jgi:hypothetical protein
MARAKTTSTTKTTAKTDARPGAQTTRRVTSLEAKQGKTLTSLEEAVVRMHHGVSVKPQAELPTNGVNDKVMGELVEIEVRAHIESGRADDLPDLPEGAKVAPAVSVSTNKKTNAIVDKLKNK